MGLLPSANFFQKSMGVHVLHGLIYNICEVYIADMLIFGTNEDAFWTTLVRVSNDVANVMSH